MENPCVEQFISAVAQSVKPGYFEFINRLNLSECRKETDLLLKSRYDTQTAFKEPLLCLLLNFHRQTNLAFQSKAALEEEVQLLKAQNARLLHEVQTTNEKAMSYSRELNSAVLDLCSHKEELIKLRSERSAPPRPFSQCDSGYTDSHSSLNEILTSPSPRKCERFPADPKSLGTNSVPLTPPRHRVNNYLTSHLSATTSDDTCSLSSTGYSAQCSSQPVMHDNFTCAHPSRGGTRTLQDCSASLSHHHESDDSCSASASRPDRTVACDANVHSHASLVSPSPQGTLKGTRLEVLELIAKDIEHFNPNDCDHHVEDYLHELDHNLCDLPNATQREKVKLVWKTSSKAVHKFIKTQPPSIRNDYEKLCQALKEEFSSFDDVTTGTKAALQVKHSRLEHPRDYYNCLRHAYFQGKNAPGLEEDFLFKSLFLKNLHPCISVQVKLWADKNKPTMHEIKKRAKIVWECLVSSKAKRTVRATLEEVPCRPPASKDHPHNRPKGGDKRPQSDSRRSRRVHQLRRDGHSQNRSCRKPYAEILAQTCEQQHRSNDEHIIFDYSSEHSQCLSDSDSASECSAVSSRRNLFSPPPHFIV